MVMVTVMRRCGTRQKVEGGAAVLVWEARVRGMCG